MFLRNLQCDLKVLDLGCLIKRFRPGNLPVRIMGAFQLSLHLNLLICRREQNSLTVLIGYRGCERFKAFRYRRIADSSTLRARSLRGVHSHVYAETPVRANAWLHPALEGVGVVKLLRVDDSFIGIEVKFPWTGNWRKIYFNVNADLSFFY